MTEFPKRRKDKVWDVDGNQYIDLWMGHYSHILGHKPNVVTVALAEAMALEAHWGIVSEFQVVAKEMAARKKMPPPPLL
jgi:glutamate-1-semialdehyde 2,1-aminomutase